MKTENEILEMAFTMFLEKGFSEISTNEIIREAGLTKGGFYYSFKSREDLDQRVIEKYIRPYFRIPTEEMARMCEKEQNLPTGLLLWQGFFQPLCFRQYRERIGQEVPFRNFYFLLYEGMKKFPEVIAYSQEMAAMKEKFLRHILKRGQERGEILQEIDLESCITMILAMQDGILALKVLDDTIDDEEKYNNIQKQMWKDISARKAYDGYTDGGVTSAVS